MTGQLRQLGLKGADVLHRRLALGARAVIPADYKPAERGHNNLAYVRHWRAQPGSSCVGHGSLQAKETSTVRWGGSVIEPGSRLHAYELGLLQQTPKGQPLRDEGTYIDAVLTGMKLAGVALERDWPPLPENVAKRVPQHVEDSAVAHADEGDWWQIHGTGDEFVRRVCWALDTFGPVINGKEVGNVYADHLGDHVMPAPDAREVSIGGHCTIYTSYRNYGAELEELNSWSNWGQKRGVIGSDGVTRQIDSIARVSSKWLTSRFFMNAYVWVPKDWRPS